MFLFQKRKDERNLFADGVSKEKSYNILNRTTQQSLMNINFYIILATFIIEFIFYQFYKHINHTIAPNENLQYILLFMFRPMLCMILVYTIGIVIRNKKEQTAFYDSVPLLTLTIFIGIIIACHSSFATLFSAIIIPVYVSSIYGDLEIEKHVVRTAAITFLIDCFIICFDSYSVQPDNLFFNIVLTFGLLFFSHVFSHNVIQYENAKEILIHMFAIDNETLATAAITDGLTQIANFKALENKTNEWIQTGQHFNFTILDIDNFKKVNDTYGHDFGNIVLKRLSQLLKTANCEDIFVARYGGEEFGILTKNMTKSETFIIVDKIRQNFASQTYRDIDQRFTFSAGTAEYRKGMDSTELFKRADDRLYKAKHNGKNQVIVQ